MPWLGLRHAGKYVSKTPEYVRAHIIAGDIPAYRPTDQPNARWIVHTDDLDAWVRSWPSYRDAAQLALDGAVSEGLHSASLGRIPQ